MGLISLFKKKSDIGTTIPSSDVLSNLPPLPDGTPLGNAGEGYGNSNSLDTNIGDLPPLPDIDGNNIDSSNIPSVNNNVVTSQTDLSSTNLQNLNVPQEPLFNEDTTDLGASTDLSGGALDTNLSVDNMDINHSISENSIVDNNLAVPDTTLSMSENNSTMPMDNLSLPESTLQDTSVPQEPVQTESLLQDKTVQEVPEEFVTPSLPTPGLAPSLEQEKIIEPISTESNSIGNSLDATTPLDSAEEDLDDVSFDDLPDFTESSEVLNNQMNDEAIEPLSKKDIVSHINPVLSNFFVEKEKYKTVLHSIDLLKGNLQSVSNVNTKVQTHNIQLGKKFQKASKSLEEIHEKIMLVESKLI